ncbi:MAG TPA: DHA2 family efflux MFS transporter permease subunit [Acetobacteraceae bacterium]|jgi:DHA2 family multidrug resistance protein|nr:DHA2 family efflux MFS transporter permease subunit [Acetobacteraceae bacterium]
MSAFVGLDAAWRPRASPWLITGAATLAPFMEILDSTIINVSVPHIAGSLSASYDDATWTLTSYLVANGVVMPVAGWIGRVVGRKRYFLISIAMFTLCSFLCGMATSLPQLVFFRLLQGLFGGGMQPCQQAIVLDTFEPSQRSRGFSVVAFAVILAPIAGPVLGGWITDTFSWRWVFLINVPIGLLAFLAVAELVEDPPWVRRDRARLADIDAIGLGLIALGLGALQIMLDRGEDAGWFGAPSIRLFALLAVMGLVGAVAWLLLTDKPIVNLRALADRNFAVGVTMIALISALLYSSNLLIPSLAQNWLGYTALLAGLLLSPGAVVMVVLIPLVGKYVLPNVQTRLLIAFGFVMLGLASWFAHNLTPDIDFTTLALFRAVQMVGLAFLFVPNSTLAYSTLPRSLNTDAAALYSMFRNIVGSVGIALATAMANQQLQTHRAHLVDHMGALDQQYQALLARTAHAFVDLGQTAAAANTSALGLINAMLNKQAAVLAYMDVFELCAVIAFLAVPLAFLFRPTTAGGRR